MLLDILFVQWQRMARVAEHLEGLPPGEVQRLSRLFDVLLQAPDRARQTLSQTPDADCAELTWLLLHNFHDDLPAETAAGLLAWAELTLEHSGLAQSDSSILAGHVSFCRGWALAGSSPGEARLALQVAGAEYRDARAPAPLQGLAHCALVALALQSGRLGIEESEEETRERLLLGLGQIRSGATAEDESAADAVQAAVEHAWAQWQSAGALVAGADTEFTAADPLPDGLPLDDQLFSSFRERALRAAVFDECSPAGFLRAIDIAEEMARRLGKPSPDLFKTVVGFLFEAKRLDRAEELLRAWLVRRPDDREALRICASALMLQEKLDAAEVFLRDALDRVTDDAELHSSLAMVLWKKGDLVGSIQQVRQALDLDPENAGAQLLARTLAQQWSTLLQPDTEEVEEGAPSTLPEAERHLQRAERMFSAARWDEAAEAYAAATRADPDLAYAYMGHGDVHYRQGRYFLAIAFFQESLALSPAAPTCRFMADSYRRIGKPDSARTAYEQALALDPHYATARASLESLLAEMEEQKKPAGAAGTPGAPPPPPRLVDPAPYHLFNLPEAPLPDLRNDPDPDEEDPQDGPPHELEPAPEPEPRTVQPDTGGRASLPVDELIRRMEEKSLPGLRALLALEPLDEQLRSVQATFPPERYHPLVMLLRVPLFFLQKREKRLDEALRLALLIHGIAGLLPDGELPDEDLGPARLRSDAAHALALVYLDLGELAQGLEHLLEAERWYLQDQEERRRRGAASTQFDRLFGGGADPGLALWRDLSRVHADLGDQERSRHYARRAREAEEGGLPGREQRFDELLAMSGFSREQGDPDQALRWLDEAVPIALGDESLILPSRLISLFHLTASLLADLRLFRTALRHLGRALDFNATRRRQSHLFQDLLLQGAIYEQRPDLGDALASYEATLRCVSAEATEGDRHAWRDSAGTTWRVIDPEDAWAALLVQGKVLEERGELARAAAVLELAIDLGEQRRIRVASPEHRIGLQAQRTGAYEDLARIEIRLAEADPEQAGEHLRRAWSCVERGRSRAFVELLGDSRLALPAEAPTPLVEREDALRGRLRDLARRDPGPGVWREYQATLDDLEEVWRHLVAASPPSGDYVDLRRGHPIRFAEARALLALPEGP